MKKITFLMLHLGYGGAEQAVIAQANLLVEKYNVEIISFYKLYENPAFEVDPRIEIKYLTENVKPNREEIKKAISAREVGKIVKEGIKSLKILYWRKYKMRTAIRECDSDVIISSRYIYHKLITKNAPEKAVCIAQEHNHHNGNEKYIRIQIQAIKDMDYFMPVSRELTEFYRERTRGMKVKCKYISHYLEKIPQENSDLTGKKIISVGRLAPEKNFVELIDIFALISKNNKDWQLHIVGDGAEKERLIKIIKENGLNEKVILHGYQNKEYIAKLMYQSSIYVMTSLTESFGLVLIEAQSFGIPCIDYDCAQGAKEIIQSYKNGILIEKHSQSQMVKELEKLISNYNYRKKIGEEGKKNALKYSKESVATLWYDFIDSITKKV